MKNLILLLILSMYITTFGQNALKFHYKLSQTILNKYGFYLNHLDANGANPTLISIAPNIKLKCILTVDGKGGINVDFWRILPQRDSFAGNNSYVNSQTTPTNFVLKDGRSTVGTATKVMRIPLRAWTFAISTMPFRYRAAHDSSDATVSPALNINFSYGYTVGIATVTTRQITNYSFTISPFIGFSSVDLKKETVKIPKTWETEKRKGQTNAAFSYGISGTISRNNFGIVLACGFDHALGKNKELWSYNDRPWFGIGINSSLGIFK